MHGMQERSDIPALPCPFVSHKGRMLLLCHSYLLIALFSLMGTVLTKVIIDTPAPS